MLRLVDDGGMYCVSHLLVDGWLAGFAEYLDTRPVAFTPDRSTLLIAADEPATLSTLFEMVEEEIVTTEEPVSDVEGEQPAPPAPPPVRSSRNRAARRYRRPAPHPAAAQASCC